MKIAITTTGNSPESKLGNRFGRCSYFAIYDTENGTIEFLLNPNKESVEGAGPASAQFILSKGVTTIVSGEFGANVKSVFNQLQIQLIMMNDPEMRVGDIVELIKHKKI